MMDAIKETMCNFKQETPLRKLVSLSGIFCLIELILALIFIRKPKTRKIHFIGAFLCLLTNIILTILTAKADHTENCADRNAAIEG